MGSKQEYVELAQRAKAGDEASMNRLAGLVTEPLRTYVGRLTLDYDLAQDIVQEALLEMVKFLNKLEQVDRFWPWLLRIATSKVDDYYKRQRRHKRASISQAPEIEAAGQQPALEDIIGQELKQVISAAMSVLKPRYRTVLTLRCYEELAYSQIAEVMGCSEFGARTLFFRAKRALARQLSRRGLGKESLLLALALFGRMTAPSRTAAAQVLVPAATTKVGVMATVVGTCTGKAAVLSVAAAGLLVIGSMVARPLSGEAAASADARTKTDDVAIPSRVSSEEYWYYYPSGVNGPLMMRLMEDNSGGGRPFCRCMQDAEANYYYDNRKNTININNYRLWHNDLSVWRLPTDSATLKTFLSETDGKNEEMECVSSDRDGLMVVVKLKGGISNLWTTHHYHVLNEEYFRYNWPAGAELIDNRDTMHKRGWTYFRITGDINGEELSGAGRVAFVHAAGKDNHPWLRLKVGDELRLEDNRSDALVFDDGKVVARYKGGSFFKGLGRPWMGLHTLDTVRRDAALDRIRFETKGSAEEGRVEVIVTCGAQIRLAYTVNMRMDVIEKVMFMAGDNQQGELRFSYLQDTDQGGDEFAAPRQLASGGKPQDSIGMLWLVRLVEDGFGVEK